MCLYTCVYINIYIYVYIHIPMNIHMHIHAHTHSIYVGLADYVLVVMCDIFVVCVFSLSPALDDFEDDFRRIYVAIEDIEQQVRVKDRLFNMNRPV